MAKKFARSKGMGTLYKHGSVWIAKLIVNGVPHKWNTHTGNRKEAEAKLREFVAPFQTGDDIQTMKNIQARIQEACDAATVGRSERQGLTLQNGWNAFKSAYRIGQQDPATMRNYEQWYYMFVDWMSVTHPEIKDMREVTVEIARKYVHHLLGGTSEKDMQEILSAREFLKQPHQSDGGSPLFASKLAECRKLASRRIRKPIRGTTLNRHLNALSLIWRVVRPNPVIGVGVQDPFGYDKKTMQGIQRIKLTRENAVHKHSALTHEEMSALANAAEGEMKILIYLGYYTGLRLGDCVLLKRHHIDWDRKIITTIANKRYKPVTCGINPALANLLEPIMDFPGDESDYILPSLAETYQGNDGPAKITKLINRVFTTAGIATTVHDTSGKTDRGVPDKTFHSLRHSCNAHLMEAGVSRATRQALLTHSTAEMTRWYEHPEMMSPLTLPDIGDPAQRQGTSNGLPEPAYCVPANLSDGDLLKMAAALKSEIEKRKISA